MAMGYRRLDFAALYALLPSARPGISVGDLMRAAGLDETDRGACQSCFQRWRKWGAIRMVNKRAGAGLWIRAWTPGEFERWLADATVRQRAGRPVETIPKPTNDQPDYEAACAQLQSLGSMCEALHRA